MENNCLVTKLKANVNDNSLLKIGETDSEFIALSEITKSPYHIVVVFIQHLFL